MAVVLAVIGRTYQAFEAVVIGCAELGVAAGFAVWTNRSRVVMTSDEVISIMGRSSTRVAETPTGESSSAAGC